MTHHDAAARPLSLETQLVHAGEPHHAEGATTAVPWTGAVAMPIYQSSTYAYGGEGDYHALRYIRLNNTPSHLALHEKLAAIEGAEAAIVAGSGMAAISTTLLSLLGAGDHLLIQGGVYGGTHDFVTRDLPALGIEHTLIDADDPGSWKAALRPRTRAIYVEAISNPLLQVGDLLAVPAFAREHGLVSLIDNTFATPVNFRPITHGFDLSLHSCSKYMNGLTDLVAGAVIGSAARIEAVKHKLDHLGGTLDPHACFLLQRGMKTLALRVRHQNESALALARHLEAHPAVARVHYPLLESHARHARARSLFTGGRDSASAGPSAGGGGVLSFELRAGLPAAKRLIERLTLPIHAPSLGGVETLITRPATTSHAGLTPEERGRLGIDDALVRVAVGIEATADLMDDFDRALRE